MPYAAEAQKNQPVVTLVIDNQYEPYSFRNNSGKADGFDVELFRAICEQVNLRSKIKPMSFADARQLLQKDSGMYVVPMLRTPKRDTVIDFANPHAVISHSLFVRKKSGIRSLSQLAGKEVMVQEGDIMYEFLLSEKIDCEIITVENQLIALTMLNNGKHDAMLGAGLLGRYFINHNHLRNIKPTGESFLPLEYSFAVSHRNSELLSSINQGLDELKENGSYNAIYNNWFSFLKNDFLRNVYRGDILIITGIIGLVILMIIIWNYMLRRVVRRKTAQLRKELEKNQAIQQDLRHSEEKYRLLTETASEMIIIHNPDGKITFANNSSSVITGYSHEEIMGMDVRRLLSSSGEEELQQRINQRKTGDDSLFTYKVEIFNKNSEVVPLEISSVPIIKNGNKEFLIIGRDISQRIQYEKQLIEAKEKAEENDKLKSTFLANMSHEIRTPLNAILGFSLLMQDDKDDEHLREKYLNIIHENGEHLLNIMNDILEFSRLEAGQARLNIRQVQIPAILTEVFENNRNRLEKSAIKFELDVSLSEQHNIIISDATRIRQVLDNLISNAIKFTEKGKIKISCETISANKIQMSVSDTGRGIKPKDQKVIFERFRQGSLEKGEIHSGTGLGLSISRSLVEMLGGTIWLNSEVNKGTEVFFTIKTDLSNNVSTKKPLIMKPTSNENPDGKSGKNILVVEDEESNYLFLEAILQREKHQVTRASDGLEAMEIFTNQQAEFDLILMDIKIPKMDGLTVTRRVKEIRPEIPVIAQTAYAMPGDKEEAMDAGCDDYVSKPLSREEVLQKINRF